MQSVDVHAHAIAMLYFGRCRRRLRGTKKLKLYKNVTTDSYRSAWGAYDSHDIREAGVIKSNGKIKLKDGTVVHGDARPGPRRHFAQGGTVTGSRAPLSAMLNYAPAYAPEDLSNDGKLQVEEGSTQYLSAGTYYFEEVKIEKGAKLILSGSGDAVHPQEIRDAR